jgi:Zn-dependent protease/Tfp pilus assembly protein PilF
MNPPGKGCFRLFTVAGVTVLIHWSWFLVAILEITWRSGTYPSPVWNVAEYLTLFGIVLLHEFGHALACRQVGGKAERIVLWPLGGIAYVNPPPRPGALLWSIVGGPLVNLLLVPVTLGLSWLVDQTVPLDHLRPAALFCQTLTYVNLGLLVFNLLPIYPLDGGQILHALLWFVLGRARSLALCCGLGLVGALGLFGLVVWIQGGWLLILPAYLAWRAAVGLVQARTLVWLLPATEHIKTALAAIADGASVEALNACDRAQELIPAGHPVGASLHACRALVWASMKDHAGAVLEFNEAISLFPGQAFIHVNRGLSYACQGDYARAEEDYLEAIRLDPTLAQALNNLAWLRATALDPRFRDGRDALELAHRACELGSWKEPNHLGTLAAAYAESGDFAAAVTWQKKALEDQDSCKEQDKKGRVRIQLYQEGKPYREELEI